MKRILSLVLALSMVLSMFTFAFAKEGVTDVAGTEYEAAVSALIELGIVDGYPDHTFKPENSITRAEVAKLLVIAAGKKAAAEDSKKATKFNDPIAEWARGYINVAAEYGYVNGYPDGSFQPNKTITYSEAVTMAVRVLGYSRVVESAGTWPTNYITKAEELKLLKGVEEKAYSKEATRGNIAIILWNMLRTDVWDITQDNETNGLTSSQTGLNLIDKYFDEYEYIDEDDEATLVSIEIDDNGSVDDGKVKVTVANTEINGYTLKGGDLLRMVPGMKVVGLANTKDKEVLTLTGADTLVEGRVAANNKINGTKYTFEGQVVPVEGDYIVGTLESKVVTASVILPEDNAEELDADEVEERQDSDDELEDIYLIGSVWGTVEDLKAGDVITEITDAEGSAVTGTYYVVARTTIKGTFDSYSEKSGKAYVEVDGTLYEVNDATEYKEYDEKDEEYDKITVDDISAKDNKYEGEECKLLCDYLGNVVAVYFDEIDENTSSAISFYVETGNYWSETSEDGAIYYFKLTDMNGKEAKHRLEGEFDFGGIGYQGTRDLLKYLTNEVVEDADGEYTVPEDVLLNLVIPAFKKTEKGVTKTYEAIDEGGYLRTDDDDAVAEYYYEYVGEPNGEDDIYDKSTGKLLNEKIVTSSTTVVTITPVMDDDEVKSLKVEITNGGKELEGVKYAMAVCETKVEDDVVVGTATKASYVFVAESSSSNDLSAGVADKAEKDDEFGVIATYTKGSKTMIDINGKTYTLNAEPAEVIGNGSLVIWTEKDEKIAPKFTLDPMTITDGLVVDSFETLDLEDGDKLIVEFTNGDKFEEAEDKMEKTTFIKVTAKKEINRDVDGKPYELRFTKATVVGKGLDEARENKAFSKYDRVVVLDEKTIVIITCSSFTEDTVITNGVVTKAD